jgi:hypothetical protein
MDVDGATVDFSHIAVRRAVDDINRRRAGYRGLAISAAFQVESRFIDAAFKAEPEPYSRSRAPHIATVLTCDLYVSSHPAGLHRTRKCEPR